MSTLSDYNINLKFEGVEHSKFTEEELTPFYNYEFKQMIMNKILIDDYYIPTVTDRLFHDLLHGFRSGTGGYKDLKKKVKTLKHEDHESLKDIIEKELRNNMDAINIAIEAFKKEEKRKHEKQYHELFSEFIKYYNFLKRQYKKIINTYENKNYKWYVTLNILDDFCGIPKTGSFIDIELNRYFIDTPQGEYFRAMFSDDQIEEAITKSIENITKFHMNIMPEKSKILAIGLNKNNFFTSTDGENIINEHVDTDTEKQARIFKINSDESVNYIENKYGTIIPSWEKIYKDWDGVIFDLMHINDDYHGNYYVPFWLRNYNYNDEHLILFNNKPVQKCVIINNETVVVEDPTLAEPSAGAGAGAGAGSGDLKKKYLKYKYKYLNLKNKK
jgi:hypothetical protein